MFVCVRWLIRPCASASMCVCAHCLFASVCLSMHVCLCALLKFGQQLQSNVICHKQPTRVVYARTKRNSFKHTHTKHAQHPKQQLIVSVMTNCVQLMKSFIKVMQSHVFLLCKKKCKIDAWKTSHRQSTSCSVVILVSTNHKSCHRMCSRCAAQLQQLQITSLEDSHYASDGVKAVTRCVCYLHVFDHWWDV